MAFSTENWCLASDVGYTIEAGEPPVFILTCARSGSSLLRLLLDGHPEVTCPPETGLAAALAKLTSVWHVLCSDERGEVVSQPPLQVVTALRRIGWEIIAHHRSQERKRIFCDKSLDTIDYVQVIEALFPGARYIVLYRDVMDVVISSIEASPWGFDSYGFGPYVTAAPGNHVAALANYWNAYVLKALDVEQMLPERTWRLRYEDLVWDTNRTLKALGGFLGVEWDGSTAEGALDHREVVEGLPGDYKVHYTAAVHSDSVGRGWRVPLGMLPPHLLEVTTRNLEKLGYAALGEPRRVPVLEDQSHIRGAGDGGKSLALCRRITRYLAESLRSLDRQTDRETTDEAVILQAVGQFNIVIDNDPEMSWVVDVECCRVDRGHRKEGVSVIMSEYAVRCLAEGIGSCADLVRAGHVRVDAQAGVATDARLVKGVAQLLNLGRTISMNEESKLEHSELGSELRASGVPMVRA